MEEETREFRGILFGVMTGAVLWVVMIYVAAVLKAQRTRRIAMRRRVLQRRDAHRTLSRVLVR